MDASILAMMEWEVSLLVLNHEDVTLYKVTRRIPSLAQADTQIFTSREQAEALLLAWLRQVSCEAP